jgi:two-component system sensor histidine kinase CreC
MRFSLRIFLGFFLLVFILGLYGLKLVRDEIKPAVRQATEESLVDMANTLAEMVGPDLVAGRVQQSQLAQALSAVALRRPAAKVWGVNKNEVAFRVYVTDATGRVVMDSTGRDLGADYSNWRDVALTLRGEYGVRTTRSDPANPLSSVMYVAAPILGPAPARPIIGVLTVVKPNSHLQPYIEKAEQHLVSLAWGLLVACLALGAIFSWGLSRGISRLTRFAQGVSEGERLPTPHFVANRELSGLAHALGRMREQLDGRAYTEQTIHALTHELKSPLTGIRASAELMGEPLTPAEHQRFAGHILAETARMQQIVDRLLDLARIEAMDQVQGQWFDLGETLAPMLKALAVQLGARTWDLRLPDAASMWGDSFLISQAVRNLLQNALDATPDGGHIDFSARQEGPNWVLQVDNTGQAVPDFAVDRVFERFYSLPSPHRKGKGSGLGLALTQAIAHLHGGQVSLQNRPEGGVQARLVLPQKQPLQVASPLSTLPSMPPTPRPKPRQP